MTYFTIDELTRSQTALLRGIDNQPPAQVRENLTALVEELLDPLREAWGLECARSGRGSGALKVGSGYRSAALNAAVGGVSSSAHCLGLAADLVPLDGCMAAFSDFVRGFLAGRAFDQLILENTDSRGVPAWIHLALRSSSGAQRGEVLRLHAGKYTRL